MSPLPPLPREDLEDVFRQVGDAWEKLRGRNVFISGASGFFGSWLLETLLFSADRRQLGVKVWALTRDVDRFRSKLPHLAGHPAVELVGGGVEQFVFPKEKMAYVIHSLVPDPGMPLPEMEKWFEMGTRRLLELAARDRSEGFLLCSTGAVYQSQNRPLSEEDPLVPLDSPLTYGRIRRQVENQCLTVCEKKGVPLKIARGFAFLGPLLPLDGNFAAGNFIRDGLRGGPIRIRNGLPTRSYLYGADLACWLWMTLLRGCPGHPYNVGAPQKISIKEMAAHIGKTLKVSLAEVGPNTGESLAAGHSFYVPETRRIETDLGVRQTVDFKKAIDKTMRWYRAALGFE